MVTITPLTMTGIFAPLTYEFLQFKRAQGYKYQSEEKILCRFCKFSERYPLSQPALTRELVSDWIASREGEAKKSRMHRVTCVSQFGRYLKQLGYEVCMLPPTHWDNDSFTPYIFTHEEIERLFRARIGLRTPSPAVKKYSQGITDIDSNALQLRPAHFRSCWAVVRRC